MSISRRLVKRWHPRLQSFVRELDSRGYDFHVGGKHIIVRTPDGIRVGILPISSSDHRTDLNALSDIRRSISQL